MSAAEHEDRGVAVVVGGSGGVGRAICRALADDGCDVVATYRRNGDGAAAAADDVRARGRVAEAWQLDLGDAGAVRALLDRAARERGGIHTIVCAAGALIPMRYVSELDTATWRDVIDADVHGFFHLVTAALPHLRESRGSLVAVTSAALARYSVKDILSAAPKAAIERLVAAIAREEGRYGIRANCVALGVVEAGMFERLRGGEIDDRWLDAARKSTPLRRFGTADEAAAAVAFLASPRASFITGQTLVVDGGYSV